MGNGDACRALLIVDVQNDFCEGGALPVEGGRDVARSITKLAGSDRAGGVYDYVVACKDWHIEPSGHFASPGTDPDYVNTWPVHCMAGTHGAEFHPDLEVAVDEVFLKGRFTASYSGFDGLASDAHGLTGSSVPSDDRDSVVSDPGNAEQGVSLAAWLDERGVTDLDIVGLATDYCVRATALDAVAAGYAATVLTANCAAVSEDTSDTALIELTAAGVTLDS